jgi:hypothetical protein
LEKRLLNCSSMNVPNRPQLKLRQAKGQAANGTCILQEVNQAVYRLFLPVVPVHGFSTEFKEED